MISVENKKKVWNELGFTMVELVIVIVLIGIIAMTASLLIGQTAQTYQKEDNYSGMTNQGRLALEEMAREIRMIRSPSDITSSCGSTTVLTFTDTNGNPVAYSYAGGTLSSGSNILATNLTGFTISYFDNNGAATTNCAAVWTVTINLTASQGGETLPMRISLHPRNF